MYERKLFLAFLMRKSFLSHIFYKKNKRCYGYTISGKRSTITMPMMSCRGRPNFM